MALAKSATLKKLLTPKVPLNEMALAKSATSVVASRSLKWHLVPFRDFWSENSLTPKVPLNDMALAKSTTLKKLLTPKVSLNEMALAKSATSVVASRSLKWHLVPFRDFWSENS